MDLDTIEHVKERQRQWAARTGRELAAGGNRFVHTFDALIQGELDPSTRSELEAGAGGELNRLSSLRSSAALAVNVFGPWRPNPGPIAGELGADQLSSTLRFEAVFPTGLDGIDPHLDVLIEGGETNIAVESKFLEMYSKATNEFRPSYFKADGLWERLPASRRLAECIDSGEEPFRWLGAAQLIKHTLGLTQSGDRFRLVLVWYRADGPIAFQLDQEIARFSELVSSDIDFEAITYQSLYQRLLALPEPAPNYFDYLHDRYFTADV